MSERPDTRGIVSRVGSTRLVPNSTRLDSHQRPSRVGSTCSFPPPLRADPTRPRRATTSAPHAASDAGSLSYASLQPPKRQRGRGSGGTLHKSPVRTVKRKRRRLQQRSRNILALRRRWWCAPPHGSNPYRHSSGAKPRSRLLRPPACTSDPCVPCTLSSAFSSLVQLMFVAGRWQRIMDDSDFMHAAHLHRPFAAGSCLLTIDRIGDRCGRSAAMPPSDRVAIGVSRSTLTGSLSAAAAIVGAEPSHPAGVAAAAVTAASPTASTAARRRRRAAVG